MESGAMLALWKLEEWTNVVLMIGGHRVEHADGP